LPEAFPVEKADEMIFYRWDTLIDRDSNVYLSRYPEWCPVYLISEAADETVYGEALSNCIKAHQLFNLGVIQLVACKEYKVSSDYLDGCIKYARKRPISL
jgi:hypothetical protein